MHVLLGLVALCLAPSGDPRAIDPAANRPEIVAPGGSPTKTKPPKILPPKGQPTTKVEPKLEPKREPKLEPKLEPKTGPRTKPKTNVTADGSPQRCFPEHGLCWRLNVAGIVAGSVGVAALGTGVGFMQAPQFPVPDEPIYNRSLRPPGVVMIAIGAITTVTGVIMIVAGHASHGKPKRQMARVRIVAGGLRW
jgi:hypothetical protein